MKAYVVVLAALAAFAGFGAASAQDEPAPAVEAPVETPVETPVEAVEPAAEDVVEEAVDAEDDVAEDAAATADPPVAETADAETAGDDPAPAAPAEDVTEAAADAPADDTDTDAETAENPAPDAAADASDIEADAPALSPAEAGAACAEVEDGARAVCTAEAADAVCASFEDEPRAACQDEIIASACAAFEDAELADCDTAAREALFALETAADADAALDESGWRRIYAVLERGGPIMFILLGLSVVALGAALVKLVQFTVAGVGAHRYAEHIIDLARRGQVAEALDRLAKKRGPLARVLEAGVRGRAMSNAREEIVREEVQRIAQSKLDGLERGLPLLSLIATVSPLLGLLGTVLGMIEAFQQLEGASDRVDPAILSGGIWEALLTTAGGLSVAIPAAALYTWLQRTVDVAGERMEDAAARIFTVDLYDADR